MGLEEPCQVVILLLRRVCRKRPVFGDSRSDTEKALHSFQSTHIL